MANLRLSFLLSLAIIIGNAFSGLSQSPKKYLKNGFYEQAFVEAVHKQNKKVKLKKKHTEVIFESYKTIYAKHTAAIIDEKSGWPLGYSKLIRMVKFRSKVTHPGVSDKLENMLYDQPVLEHLAMKFNDENRRDLEIANNYESVENYEKAFDLYKGMSIRHEQAKPITTMTDRLILIDCEAKIEHVNQKIGDQYIDEAEKLLESPSKQAAEAAIKLIEKARAHRPLDLEEEEILTLANLIIGESWIVEAEKLIQTRTKKNARLAYELINRARTKRALSAEEEQLLETAKELGVTRVFVKVKGKKPIHDAKSLSGILNKGKNTPWATYYFEENNDVIFDFEMEVSETQPSVILGDIRKQIKQSTKTVEYWENETDAEGNVVKVKKTRLAVAMVAIVSRTKTSRINWSMTSNDVQDGKAVHSETRESKVEVKNEYASLESGDALAFPENIESEVELDSQPFPTDEEMLDRVKRLYIKELTILVNTRKDHLRNINSIIPE